MDRQSSVHTRLETVTDISKLSSIADDVILACLRQRFLADNIYTSVGTSGLVAFNPHKYVPSNSDAALQQYASNYRNTDRDKETLPPHIFQLANNAYYHMRRTTQDECIVFTGETASGKSENRRLAIKSILELSVSSPGKKGAKLGSQIPASEFVLESFGNCRTLFNANASRFGKYTELQFNDRGRVCGIKTIDYYLERNRVCTLPSGERNFHIFYYLVAGASPEERAHLHLGDKTGYRFLGNTSISRNGPQDNDHVRFDQLKVALKTIGFSKRHVAQTCQLVAAILHLGNLEFVVDRHRNEDAAVVRNTDVLAIVADFLGVHPTDLEAALSYRTRLVKKELCTVFLDPDGASDNRDDLAKTLYSLLFAWVNEHINQRLCKDDFSTFIGLLDLPGPQDMSSRPNSLDQFCINFANERLQHWLQRSIFENNAEEYAANGVSQFVPKVPYFDNTECLRMLQNRPGGLIHIMDDQARRMAKKTDQSMVEAFQKRWGNHSSFKSGAMDRAGFPTFTVNHYHGSVTYSAEGFLERNMDALNPDFVSLLRGAADNLEGTGSENPFVKGLFSAKAIATQAHPRHEETIVAAQQAVKPMRAPSTRRKSTTVRRGYRDSRVEIDETVQEEEEGHPARAACVAGEFKLALDTLFETLDETQAWYVFCVNPNDSQLPNQLEGRSVRGQLRSMGIPEIAKQVVNVFEVGMSPAEFCERYKVCLDSAGVEDMDPVDRVESAAMVFGLGEADAVLGTDKVYLSQWAFHLFEDFLRAQDVDEQKRNRLRDAEAMAGLNEGSDPYGPYPSTPQEDQDQVWDHREASSAALPLVANASPGPFRRADMYTDDLENRSLRSDDLSQRDDITSEFGSESYAPSRNMFQVNDKKPMEGEVAEIIRESSARRRWVALCWMLTWWVPTFLLTYIGRMKRLDVRQAWREKLALNMLIWFVCGCTIFVIIFLGNLICPTQHVYNTGELAEFNSKSSLVYTSIRGEVFDLGVVNAQHLRAVSVVPSKMILTYGGTTSDNIFPVQVSALCDGIDGHVSPFVTLDSANNTDPNAAYHDFRVFTNDSRPDWYWEQMVTMRYTARVGFLGYTPKDIKNKAAVGKSIGIYNGLVYDVSTYINFPPAVRSPDGSRAPDDTDTEFMHKSVLDVFKFAGGTDITKELDGLNIDKDILQRQKVCLRNLFLIGKVDNRQSAACQFSKYLLLIIAILMVSIIGFKFLAALNFSAMRAPEDHDKFVICQVPCYTEGESSLRTTIDSLARMNYDDKRKLLVVICDGMIVGSGNDRPTPRIVLDILGSDPNLDPEPLSFVSLGEGAKQHNMGKIYSGLYEVAGHVVPYLVVVKVGKPTERSRPGNRGKRDSQMVVMHFLNKVHFNSPMNPMELEMYHQIKNVIGVNPTFYEYLFTIDADTTVDAYSVNRLISSMIRDKKLLGVCGETSLANAKQSIITMMQVYEYFISHHMAKAFESLFGSVTCLPGCFTLFRLRTSDTQKPLLISHQMIKDYSENRVDTLHMKNLLHLGEDRYLTTLLLKHFPNFKTQFVRDARAYTVAPDDWKVLLSQRRRWINSTVHNLGELVFLDQLCGFCCFSMRFIVMIDLVSTITQPIMLVYIVYLIYLVVTSHQGYPTTSIIMLAAIYGLQALIFIFRQKWDMIGWMLFYVISFPIFTFLLPIYSFWKMDDFSWGATRMVLGESGKKMIVHDEGKFDPRAIPLKSWNDYENELWDKESNHSIGSWVPPSKMKDNNPYAESYTASLYGRETYYEPGARSYSPAPSKQNMPFPPSGFNSGRNTPQYTQSPMGYQAPAVLRTADLNSVTKKDLRRHLEERFGVDLTEKKARINAMVDRLLEESF
ncbi:glycosyltransferase family 2 protein [Hymenopellis radicata]|nr:glycosyltransferase family 2 protein [Hymenopellis radicata]